MGFADTLAHPNGPMRPQHEHAPKSARDDSPRERVGSRPSLVSAAGIEPATGGLREHPDDEE